MMKNIWKRISVLSLCLLASCSASPSSATPNSNLSNDSVTSSSTVSSEEQVSCYSQEKSYQRTGDFRTIITTDGECDDQNSLIHALLYSNQLNIKGIVYTASILHWGGDEEHEAYRNYGTEWIEQYLDQYALVQDNLKKHDDAFPTAEYLKSVTKVGNYAYKNDMTQSTDGSQLIAEEIQKEDDSRLYLLAWGGCNTIGRALKDIEEAHQNDADWSIQKQKISEKITVSMISLQDSVYADYLSVEWPDVSYILHASQFGKYGFTWKTGKYKDTLMADWQKEYILHEDNPLLSLYHSYLDGVEYPGEREESQYGLDIHDSDPNDGKIKYNMGTFSQYDFLSEGDSPSFLMLLDNGLEGLEVDHYGTWAGYFMTDETNPKKRIDSDATYNGIFIPDISRDFAERIRWSEGKGSLHQPSLEVKEGKYVNVKKGETVTLTAVGSDPDQDTLTYQWQYDDDNSTYTKDDFDDNSPNLSVKDNVATITFKDATKAGDVFHYYAKVYDDATLGSVRYVDVKVTIVE